MPSIDSQYFAVNANFYDEKLIGQDAFKISHLADEIKETDADKEHAPFNFQPDYKYFNDLWEAYQANAFRIDLEGNHFIGNAMGGRGAVTKIEGFPAFVAEKEVYSRNENWFEPIFQNKSLINKIAARYNMTTPPSNSSKQPMLTAEYLASYELKAEAVLSAHRLTYATLQSFLMIDNYVVDDVVPTKEGVAAE